MQDQKKKRKETRSDAYDRTWMKDSVANDNYEYVFMSLFWTMLVVSHYNYFLPFLPMYKLSPLVHLFYVLLGFEMVIHFQCNPASRLRPGQSLRLDV